MSHAGVVRGRSTGGVLPRTTARGGVGCQRQRGATPDRQHRAVELRSRTAGSRTDTPTVRPDPMPLLARSGWGDTPPHRISVTHIRQQIGSTRDADSPERVKCALTPGPDERCRRRIVRPALTPAAHRAAPLPPPRGHSPPPGAHIPRHENRGLSTGRNDAGTAAAPRPVLPAHDHTRTPVAPGGAHRLTPGRRQRPAKFSPRTTRRASGTAAARTPAPLGLQFGINNNKRRIIFALCAMRGAHRCECAKEVSRPTRYAIRVVHYA